MKKFLAAAGVSVFGLAGGLGSAHAINVNTQEMISICQDRAESAQNFCNGYAQGVYDMYVSNVHPTRNPAFICFPNPGPSRAEVIKGFIAWASGQPQFNGLPAADTMMRYLGTTYPCKK